jgi:dTDP-4-amino-4,6-dideoxygalactose transaminase
MALAREYDLFVVEDVAQAFGGSWQKKKVGAIGNTGCYSFFPSKNLGGFGDGGMVSTDDAEIAGLVRMLLKHGGKDKYNVDHIGYNARLDTLQAAVLLAKFKYIDEFNDRRRKIAETYSRELAGTEGLVVPLTPDSLPTQLDDSSTPLSALPGTTQQMDSSTNQLSSSHVYHQYTVRVLNGKRDAFQKHLQEQGVSSMVYYPFPLHKMKVFSEGRSKIVGGLGHSEKASSEVLSLPVEPLMKDEDIFRVARAVKGFFSA